MTDQNENNSDVFNFSNYCVCFIDLLGQKDAMRGQRLMPIFESEVEKQKFIKISKESVGKILRLQEDSETMLRESGRQALPSEFIDKLTNDQKETWKESRATRLVTQRWSDGLVYFTSLNTQEIKCPLNAIYNMICTAGGLAFMGLARKTPIRGGIDIAWGIELNEGELYGPAVAWAYEMESVHAQYPRVAVSPQVIHYLRVTVANPETDIFSNMNRELAKTCLELVHEDLDGFGFIHYLGQGFYDCVSHDYHDDMYNESKKNIIEKLEKFKQENNTKLSLRYAALLNYFEYFNLGTIQKDADAG